MVLQDGVIEGRKVFGNITKYIKMGASSNFGNMFSVLGASLFLPFLPMAPIQVLTNNLLYDFSQTRDPHRQRRRGLHRRAAPLGYRQHLQVHGVHRADQLDLRLRHLRDHAARLRCLEQPLAVPDRLVRRVAPHPDADHSHHPHGQGSLHREPGQSSAHRPRPSSSACVGIALPFTWIGSALGFTPLPWLVLAAGRRHARRPTRCWLISSKRGSFVAGACESSTAGCKSPRPCYHRPFATLFGRCKGGSRTHQARGR